MWGRKHRFEIISSPKISAVYFGLLQGGYEYFASGRRPEDIRLWEGWRDLPIGYDTSFFKLARQSTSSAYPYWPRAAMLETATFFVDAQSARFQDFKAYHLHISAADNIQDRERNQDFWNWVKGFPKALCNVMSCAGFGHYRLWEESWVRQQADAHRQALQHLEKVISYYIRRYGLPVAKVSVVLCPLKCKYSADYHRQQDAFCAIAGELRPDSVLHEFLHLVMHPLVQKHSDAILALRNLHRLGLEESYFLVEGERGKLYAFEEYAVREVAELAAGGKYQTGLEQYLLSLIKALA